MARIVNPIGILEDSLDFKDDEALSFGNNDRFEIVYDSGQSELQLVNGNTGNIVFSVDLLDEDIVLNGLNTIKDIPDPVNAGDIANKNFVENNIQPLSIIDAVVAATDGTNIDLTATTDPNPIDGVTLTDGDRVLLKDQTDATQNGIYDAVTATDPSTWVRSADFDEDSEVTTNSYVFINKGTNNANSSQIVASEDPISVGTDDIVFETFSASGDFSAGDGLNLSGSEFSINVADFVGTFLSDDGTNDITVDLGVGLENDGTGSIAFDEDPSYTFTSNQTFAGDILDGASNTIYDQSNAHIPIAILQNNSIDVTSGDGLKNGGNVQLGNGVTLNIEPSDFAGQFITDDGFDDLTVQLASSLEGDGTGNIRVNGGEVAGNVLTEGTNPFEVDVNLGNGVENNTGLLRINPADIAGNGLGELTDTTLGVVTDGIGLDEIDEAIAPTWLSTHTFAAGLVAQDTIDMDGTSLVKNLPAPDGSNDATRKSYVDGVASGLAIKSPVRVGTETNIDLTSTTDPNPVNGVTLNDGDRVLLKEQTDATENGIYDAVTATDPSTWVRSSDADEDSEVVSGLFIFVEEGDTTANKGFVIVTEDPISLGSTEIEFGTFSSAGSVTAGDGLTQSGDTLNIAPVDFAGTFLSDDGSDNLQVNTGNGLEGDGVDNIRINPAGIAGNALVEDTTTTLGVGSNVIGSTELVNDSVTVTAGDGLKTGGAVALGGSVTLDIDVSDFAGTFLSDDGTENLQVDVGLGLENDGTGSLRIDEDAALTFTSLIGFNGGLSLADAAKIFFGTGDDISTRYDATTDDLKWRDEANTTDRMALDRTTGDLTVDGTFDETSSP